MVSGTRLNEELGESNILYWVGRSLGNLLDGRNLVQTSHHVMDASRLYSKSRHAKTSQPASSMTEFNLIVSLSYVNLLLPVYS